MSRDDRRSKRFDFHRRARDSRNATINEDPSENVAVTDGSEWKWKRNRRMLTIRFIRSRNTRITKHDRSSSMAFLNNSKIADDELVEISNIYLCSLCLSPVLHVLDVGTDTYLAYQYCAHGEYAYFVLTIIFVAGPAFISTLFSIRMYARDRERVSCFKWTLRCMLHALQISPVIRYIEAFQHALALRKRGNTSAEYKEHSTLLLKEDSNLALLRILECFLEAAPQQVLQITILLTPGRPTMPALLQIYLYMSLVTSFLSTSWTFAMYHRSIRFARKDKIRMKWVASIVQFFWILSIMTSRILTIGEAASVYPQETLAICAAHWWVMTVWLSMFEKTSFCSSATDSSKRIIDFKETMFCAVIGLMYIFSYVTVTDQPTHYKYLFYYSICFLENCSSAVVWLLKSTYAGTWWFWFLPTVTVSFFALGIVMMQVYYSCYHPSMCNKPDIVQPNMTSSPEVEKTTNLECATQANE